MAGELGRQRGPHGEPAEHQPQGARTLRIIPNREQHQHHERATSNVHRHNPGVRDHRRIQRKQEEPAQRGSRAHQLPAPNKNQRPQHDRYQHQRQPRPQKIPLQIARHQDLTADHPLVIGIPLQKLPRRRTLRQARSGKHQAQAAQLFQQRGMLRVDQEVSRLQIRQARGDVSRLIPTRTLCQTDEQHLKKKDHQQCAGRKPQAT